MRTDTSIRKTAFLRLLRHGDSVIGRAPAILGLARKMPYEWRVSDPAFRAAWDAIRPPGRFPTRVTDEAARAGGWEGR